MANQPEVTNYDAGVYQIETTDPVQGGVGGLTNKPLLNLSNRTNWLYSTLQTMAGSNANANALIAALEGNINAVVSAAGLADNIPNTALLLAGLQALFRAKGPINLYPGSGDYVGTLAFADLGAFPGGNDGYGGYVRLPGGWLIQSVNGQCPTGQGDVFYWPTAFPNACLGAVTSEGAAGGWQNVAPTIHGVSNPNTSYYQHYAMQWNGGGYWQPEALSFQTIAYGY